MSTRVLALSAALLLGACASKPPVGPPAAASSAPFPGASAPPAAAPPVGAVEALAIQRQWFETWFKGTPVRIEARTTGAFDVSVALEFCFDPGRSAVKAALAAVLDKLAETLRRAPLASVTLIAAPADKVATPALALQRAKQVRDYLLARGVTPARLGTPTVAAAALVRLHVTPVAPVLPAASVRQTAERQSPSTPLL